MSLLVKQAGIISAADFLRLFIKTVIGMFLARILTQAEYGTYRQLFLLYTIISAIFLVGIPQSVYYFIPKADEAQKKKIITQTLDIVSILGLLGTVLIIISRSWISESFNNPQLFKALLVFALYPFFMFVTQLYYSIMISLQRPRKAALYVILSVICDFLLILGTAILTRNLLYIAAAIIISVFIQWIYARINLKSHTERSGFLNFDIELVKSQVKFSLPIGIAAIVGVISSQIDKLVISSNFSPELFAIFSVGATELPFIGIITNSVNAIILPEMSRRTDDKSVVDLYRGAVRKNALLLLPIFTFCVILAPQIIQILYSAKYLDAVVFFRIYLFTIPLRIATYGLLFQVYNKTRYIFILSFITLILTTALSIVLIGIIGIKGPAIAAVFVTYLTVMLYLILIKYKLKLNILQLFPVLAILKTMLSAILAAILTYPIIHLSENIYIQFVIGTVIFLPLYYLIASLLGAIIKYDRDVVKDIFQSLFIRLKGPKSAR
jgi:O-antigen/teichoic acid export membrane protein